MSQSNIILLSMALLLIVAMGEWLHARKTRRIARLSFGPAGRPRLWVTVVAPIRCIATGLLCWGLLTLLSLDGASVDVNKAKPPDRHLVLALDVSPSMYINDAGPDGRLTRQNRAAEVVQSLIERLDMTQTRVTVIAFYTSARPVVIDTFDISIVNNILYGLPLSQAFKQGKPNMPEGLSVAAKIAAPWRARSTTLVLVSDRDKLPETGRVVIPPSIADAIIIGVGNPQRASTVGETMSRQDAASLKRLAAQVRGTYYDANVSHIPTAALKELTMHELKDDRSPPLKTIALSSIGVGSIVMAMVPLMLAAFGLRSFNRVARAQVRTPGGHIRTSTGVSA